ncbi:amino acid ABC transporter ATP-binding protein [Rhizobium sp. NLR10a]|uniref:amino acid ABC transporter ATP-binding protein n=1 Tax=unclassified Rhizobium TaxID=2613769 RepID=UPI001C8371DE|nr:MULTISPECIES: ATP-binding cassette domain-containing protein [unclassified Rhizobium]MBX5213732.1 amino acid ABC transporter ATP-binding protein [Rhizobium sp. NLR9a]MBX5275121.1 amino acid ABC transporter ATP-binding protein [Rhizobium sp. NLR13a]MBX5281319.1 amino acid ABC transporter ATP-binding protein [Rhizobium sp. NLR10a]MBX5294648.1 amino acid ABC transporter ATP-binding protein [Rhizobium sp. NLR15a]
MCYSVRDFDICLAPNDLKKIDEVCREVGMVFQHFNLFPHLRSWKSTLAPIWVPRPRRSRRKTSPSTSSNVSRSTSSPTTIGPTQQQRVAIARSLCMNPRVMLFDEPTSVLDPEMTKEVLDTMVGLAEEGMTMIGVTHENGFARQVANRVILLDRGEIVEQNSPAEFFDNPQHERTRLFLSRILR